MTENSLHLTILDSLKEPVVFVDTGHIIRYMNPAAYRQYHKYGPIVGKSLLACHNPESVEKIREIFIRFQNGESEVLYSENGAQRSYMRAVRDAQGVLMGYCERFEPPKYY